ncbi:STM3941 family protein [Neorhizobium sp. NCHU2750]|uniref:STM3941 family protein n=1 Tax=Neorhizobium sp. NCHU2750 TaxID=1825976 RepID=UPI000E723738|nr:hypothetical protein NCHU2750_32790 [Neorhizobium sp. NCHU2750]
MDLYKNTLNIAQDTKKMALWALAGAIVSLLCAASGLHLIKGAAAGCFDEFLLDCGALFFGGCTIALIYRLYSMGGAKPVVTLGPEGFCDVRIASGTIPWAAIQGISTAQIRRQKFVVLTIDPAIEAGLGLTAMTRWTRNANRSLGIDGLCVATQGLKIGHKQLLDKLEGYMAARANEAR